MVPLRIGVALVLLATGQATAQSRDAADYLDDCSKATEVAWCEADQETFPADLAGAFAGDYQGIRNVSYCLSTGCNGSVRIDKVQGCAWRAFAYAAAPTGAEKISEQQNMETFCKGVPEQHILAYIDAITPLLN